MLPVKHLKDPIHTSNLFIQIWILIRQVIQKLRRHLLLLLLCLLNSGLRRGSSRRRRRRDRRTKKNPALRQR
ncbi:putative protein [Arabidopsis thaliana]|uniref:Transmembrane protein n=2 Tax=Arabidopsis thaliana TaxID=3702 RepID=A0A654G1A4_ARATH|nr:uncharacterized protein AT5G15581 [Arabidopsis thaliana]AED92181.2 transmembrane protein [Arabidopsis thaliana]CAA0402801.1 unnamed protein product [Arabidopsis thaliana]CAC01758.1 putative protein [Arabidopsis thaliana]VYS66928.1 unnamed protein product [Arabidopsis thaliana]|eukprot:NP_001318569.1 transmembrane protein [Arabidopsis thaliana]